MSCLFYKELLRRNFRNVGGNFINHSPCFFSSTTEGSKKYDLVIVGGGIVGIASAREVIQRHPKLRMAVLEKENKVAFHQSGRNSGVIHAGIYYKPGSLKAKLCVEGLNLTYEYLDKNNIPYKKVGKLIVATDATEVVRLQDLHERAKKNGVRDTQMIEGSRIQEIEPHCRGVKALWSPHTGIVDFGLVTQHYAKDFQQNGGDIHLNFEVVNFKEGSNPDYPVTIIGKNGQRVETKYVLTCGGLYSDKLAEFSGCSHEPRIVPFRGEYLLLNPDKRHLVKGNIYPVPDPRFPFLGVHFTPRMDGNVWLGPNAVLAFKREGYKWSDVHVGELFDAVRYGGFVKLAARFLLPGANELLKSMFISLQVKDLQKFIPSLRASDVTRGPAGVRAQALDGKGQLIEDFVFDMGENKLGKRILHCRNAPSPGATSSLAIAKMMADRLAKEFKFV